MLPDTLGILNHEETYLFCKQIVDKFPNSTFDFHAHNDYDLATANVFAAIKEMHTRGAPLIGAVAAYGVWLASRTGKTSQESLMACCDWLDSARPTAVNLFWALQRQRKVIEETDREDQLPAALLAQANLIAEEDVEVNHAIGQHGLELIRDLHRKNPGRPVQILTHCNAGWLATLDWGKSKSHLYHALH